MDARKTEQYKALGNWKNNNFVGTAICCTGFGKTYLGIVASCLHIRRDSTQKWLVLVPTINLISQWRSEAYKWGFGKEWDENVECICYQSAYKYKDKHYSGVICDEIHTGLSPEYRKVFIHNKFDRILCLTATEPEEEEYRVFLREIAPIMYSITLEEAVKLKIVAPFKIYCLGIDLEENEALEYKRANNNFVYYKKLLGEFDAFDMANTILAKRKSDYNTEEEYKEERKNAILFFKAIRERGDVVKNAFNKLEYTRLLVEKFNDRKCITFSETNKFTDKTFKLLKPNSLRYHSGLSLKERENSLIQFKTRNNLVLCSTKALNAGLDVPSASLAIIQSLTSKALPLIQRVGRVIRFEMDKIGIIFILYVKNSQEESWLENAIYKLDKSNIEYINNLEDV
jgi:superfamily II DNA or RNA helicase